MDIRKYLIFFLCCLAPFACKSDMINEREEVREIEHKIQKLETHLHKDRLLEMSEQVKGQDYMIADWKTYGEELERVHKQEHDEKQTEMEIKKLQQEKEQLLLRRSH